MVVVVVVVVVECNCRSGREWSRALSGHVFSELYLFAAVASGRRAAVGPPQALKWLGRGRMLQRAMRIMIPIMIVIISSIIIIITITIITIIIYYWERADLCTHGSFPIGLNYNCIPS